MHEGWSYQHDVLSVMHEGWSYQHDVLSVMHEGWSYQHYVLSVMHEGWLYSPTDTLSLTSSCYGLPEVSNGVGGADDLYMENGFDCYTNQGTD